MLIGSGRECCEAAAAARAAAASAALPCCNQSLMRVQICNPHNSSNCIHASLQQSAARSLCSLRTMASLLVTATARPAAHHLPKHNAQAQTPLVQQQRQPQRQAGTALVVGLAAAGALLLSPLEAQAVEAASVFTRSCAGCHAGGGNVIRSGTAEHGSYMLAASENLACLCRRDLATQKLHACRQD